MIFRGVPDADKSCHKIITAHPHLDFPLENLDVTGQRRSAPWPSANSNYEFDCKQSMHIEFGRCWTDKKIGTATRCTDHKKRLVYSSCYT